MYNFKLSALVMLIYSIDSMAKALIADLKELFLEWQSQVSNNAAKEEEVYLTPDEVVCKYHTSKVTLWRNVKSGAWPKPVKIGGKTLYRKSEIEKVLNPGH